MSKSIRHQEKKRARAKQKRKEARVGRNSRRR